MTENIHSEMSTDEIQANRCLSDNVCFTLYTAGNALVRAYRPLLDECGLTYPQYLLMQALWLNDGISLTQLSQATHLGLGTLTLIVKRLETKDLLICAIDAQDERKKVIKTTPTGLALKQEALVLKQILLDKVTLSEVEIELLRKMCITLTQDLNSKE